AECLPGDLLHRLPLLLERYPSGLLRLLVCGELPIGRRARQVRQVRLSIRELKTLTRGRYGHLPLHQIRASQISLRNSHEVSAVLAELRGIHSRHAVGHARIPVDVRDIDVVHDGGVVDRGSVEASKTSETAVIACSPPAMERLERSDWAPANIAESKADSEALAEADEGYQRRRPVVVWGVVGGGIPCPTQGILIEPIAVMIGRPAPGIVADPGPAVVINPGPVTIAIRSPVGGYARMPGATVSGVHPIATVVQILGAVNVAIHVGI